MNGRIARPRLFFSGRPIQVDNVENESLDISPSEKWRQLRFEKAGPAGDTSFLGERSSNAEKNSRVMTLRPGPPDRDYLQRVPTSPRKGGSLPRCPRSNPRPISPRARSFGGGVEARRGGAIPGTAPCRGRPHRSRGDQHLRPQPEAEAFDRLYRTGARLSADFTQDFPQFPDRAVRDINNSSLAVSLVQPLLRGGGKKVTLEALTQADRNVLYSLRDFANFRREFIVSLVADYYGVLQARDNVNNAYLAYSGFRKTVIREEGLAEEGKRSTTQIGQLKQALLVSESRWLSAIRSYESRLDQFKLTLGIPVEEDIVLDDRELNALKIVPPWNQPERSSQDRPRDPARPGDEPRSHRRRGTKN